MPIIAPKPVNVRITPTIMFSRPTAFRVGFQNKGARNTTATIIRVGSICKPKSKKRLYNSRLAYRMGRHKKRIKWTLLITVVATR